MGCDCGCGGTCGICAPRLASERLDHAYEIRKTAKMAQAGSKPTKKKKESNKK